MDQEITVEVIDPFAIVDSKEYQIVFDTLETSEDLAFSIRNQELILETLTINSDSSAVATYDNLDAKIRINSTVINDSTVYDTIHPSLSQMWREQYPIFMMLTMNYFRKWECLSSRTQNFLLQVR